MRNIFTEHPQSVDETYLQHLIFALKFSGNLLLASMACFIHALCPFLFHKTGSNLVAKMAVKLSLNKRKELFDEQLKTDIDSQAKSN